jgi:hypothetical protein
VAVDNCDHKFVYAGLRYRDGKRSLPGTGATRRYYAHVYFCEKCLTTKGKSVETTANSYLPPIAGAVIGTAEECCVDKRDR